MRALTKKLPISAKTSIVRVSVQDGQSERHFELPVTSVRTWLRELRAQGVKIRTKKAVEAISADQFFREMDQRYSRPGSALRGARAKEGLSQYKLASLLGIPQGNLSKMETGKRSIGRAMAKRLGKILGVDYRVFL